MKTRWTGGTSHRSLSVVVDSTFVHALGLLLLSQRRHWYLFLSASPVSPPQALGAGCSGQPSPLLLLGDLCLHRWGGEAAGSCTDPQPREAAGAHPGNASCLCALVLTHSPAHTHSCCTPYWMYSLCSQSTSGKYQGWYGHSMRNHFEDIFRMNITFLLETKCLSFVLWQPSVLFLLLLPGFCQRLHKTTFFSLLWLSGYHYVKHLYHL